VRIVVALGGNALLRRGERPDQEVQQRNVATAVGALVSLAEAHEVVVTHGNGPQVGMLALAQEALPEPHPLTLDVLGSLTQGMIGYLIEDALRDALPGREVATLLTQVEVAADDPAFESPTKPIGPMYDAAEAERLARERGWTVGPDGDGFRRLVASPEPRRILEIAAVRILMGAGVIVVCAGGGGVPVVVAPDGACYGVEAVVDKDLTAALLATELEAGGLLMLTDVPAAEEHWRTPEARAIREATPSALRARTFAPGTMGPKVEAACRFVEAGGAWAGIGSVEDAAAIVAGTAGTTVRAQVDGEITFWA
jgi:carbamate kinase